MRGSETIIVTPKGDVDWQGDPTGATQSAYPIAGCVIWPVMRADDGSLIPNVLDVYVPIGTLGPEDGVDARGHNDWSIDGGTEGRYVTKSGRDKGLIFRIKRLA